MREDSSSDLFTNTELLWEGGLNQKELFDRCQSRRAHPRIALRLIDMMKK